MVVQCRQLFGFMRFSCAEIVYKLVWVVQALMGQTTRPFDNNFRRARNVVQSYGENGIVGRFFVPGQYNVGNNASYCVVARTLSTQ
jgi:hypothetical protein